MFPVGHNLLRRRSVTTRSSATTDATSVKLLSVVEIRCTTNPYKIEVMELKITVVRKLPTRRQLYRCRQHA